MAEIRTKRQLMDFLEQQASSRRRKILDSLKRSRARHELTNIDLWKLERDPGFAQRVVDAVLVDFIDEIGGFQGLNEGYSTKYLKHEEATQEIQELTNEKYPDLFGTPKAFRIWLESPHEGLSGRTPQSVIDDHRADIIRDLLLDMVSGQPT